MPRLDQALRHGSARRSRARPAGAPPAGRSLLSSSDFGYLGSFLRPKSELTPWYTGTVVARLDSERVQVSPAPGAAPASANGVERMFRVTTGPNAGYLQGYNKVSPSDVVWVYPSNLPSANMVGQTVQLYVRHTNYNGGTYGGGGLGLRRVGGQVRLCSFNNSYQHYPYEFSPPAEASLRKTAAALPAGAFVQTWVDLGSDGAYQHYNGGWVLNAHFGGDNAAQGLFWDGDDLYLFYGGDYQIQSPCPSFMKLHDNGDGTFARYGPYRMESSATGANISFKRAMGGMVPIPQAFADASLAAAGAKRLGVMGGGYWSLFAAQGGSAGPCLSAISVPPDVAYDPAVGTPDDGETGVPRLPAKILLAYGQLDTDVCRRPVGPPGVPFVNRNYSRQYPDGPCRGATATTLTLWMANSLVSPNTFDGMKVLMTSGAGSGQTRTVTTFAGSTSTCNLNAAWTTTPSAGDTYLVYDGVVQGATAGTVTLQAAKPSRPYFKILTGAGAGQDERTLALVSGTTYAVSPAFDVVPAAGDLYLFYSGGYGGVADPAADGSHAYWSWGDGVQQAHVWIDGASKHGLLSFPSFGVRHQWYDFSDLRGRGRAQYWLLFDPADLAGVAAGQLAAGSVVPTWWSPLYDDGAGNSRNGYLGTASPTAEPPATTIGGGRLNTVMGAAHDAVASRLYLLEYVYPDVYYVHVYSVNA